MLYSCIALTISSQANADLIITNAQIINPTEKLVPKKGYIIIHNDRIKKVGYGQIKPPKNASVYDAHHQYVIPGLIDSHNHIDAVLGLGGEQEYPNFILEYRKQLPKSYLYFGYTTVIDLATTDQITIQTFKNNPTHPDLFTCGGGIMVMNGYPMNEFPEAMRLKMFPNFLYEPNEKAAFPPGTKMEEHTPRAIIKRIVKANAVCVKVFYESGFGADKNLPLPSLASVREIVKLAHQHHLPVLIHANSFAAQTFALASGADIFAHGLWNWGPYENETGLPTPIQNILDQVIAKQLGYQPTMQVLGGLEDLFDANFLKDPQLRNVIPEPLLD